MAAGNITAHVNHHHEYAAIATGANGDPLETVKPTTRTRKKVPMASIIYLFISVWVSVSRDSNNLQKCKEGREIAFALRLDHGWMSSIHLVVLSIDEASGYAASMSVARKGWLEQEQELNMSLIHI